MGSPEATLRPAKAADLQWLGEQGVEVKRYNLVQEPQAFAANPAVLKEMKAGMERLPVIVGRKDRRCRSVSVAPATGTETRYRVREQGQTAHQDRQWVL